MNVSVIARHCDIGDGLRRRVEVRAERLRRYHERLRDVDVIFSVEGGRRTVEVRAVADREAPLVGLADAQVLRIALDRAMDKVERQARRARERRLTRKPPRIAVAP